MLWVGVSFEQSASTEYFKRVRRVLQEGERLSLCHQAIVNLSDEALWNLLSANNNVGASPVAIFGTRDLPVTPLRDLPITPLRQ